MYYILYAWWSVNTLHVVKLDIFLLYIFENYIPTYLWFLGASQSLTATYDGFSQTPIKWFNSAVSTTKNGFISSLINLFLPILG